MKWNEDMDDGGWSERIMSFKKWKIVYVYLIVNISYTLFSK